jgi:hypothetical protein
MKKEHTKLVEKVLQSFDWNSIFEINKILKVGIGDGNEIIPGLKKKIFNSDLSKSDYKTELRFLIKHAIKNHLSQFTYGNWIIYWASDDWSIEMTYPLDDEDPEFGEEDHYFVIEPQLEIIYSPQRIFLKGKISEPEEDGSDPVKLEDLLQRAIENEDYEQATKIRDLISKNNGKNLDK